MAGFIVICSRDRAAAPRGADLRRSALRLSPHAITPNPPDVYEEPGLARVVINPVPGVRVEAGGICLGTLFGDADWARLGGPPPDGTFAIARHDDEALELVTDVFASRTIWYLHLSDTFLASTSQRALVALAGSYEPNPEAVTWLLAAGNLGPDGAWDARLRRVPSRTRLRLDRHTWELTSTQEELRYESRALPDSEHLARLWEAIHSVCATLDTDLVPTALTLSGGCDSRSLLVALADAGKPVRCVTWGLAAALADPRNDAAIARRLAARFGMPHEYHELDFGDIPAREVFSRFLRAGEGRLEDFSGYTDGFRAWRRLFDAGTATVVRGDCPGWGSPYAPISEAVARSINMHCTLVSDYPDSEPIHRLDLAPQRRPEGLYQRDHEPLDDYRDRLYNDFELPTCMAAMNDVKCAYVEVVNPLYGREVVRVTTELPERLRHCRSGFERLVATLVPDIPFSETQADEPAARFLRRPEMRNELLSELSSQAARSLLSEAACAVLIEELERPLGETRADLRRRLRAHVPPRLVRAVRPEPRPHLDAARLAYRAYLASRMDAILREDAVALRQRDGSTPSASSQ